MSADRLSTDRLSAEERFVLEASTALRLADTAVLAVPDADGRRPALDELLTQLGTLLRRAAEAIDSTHFTHLMPQRSMGSTAGG